MWGSNAPVWGLLAACAASRAKGRDSWRPLRRPNLDPASRDGAHGGGEDDRGVAVQAFERLHAARRVQNRKAFAERPELRHGLWDVERLARVVVVAGERGGGVPAGETDRRDWWKEGLMAKRKAPAPSAKAAPAKERPTKADAAKAALKAKQPDLLDLLSEKPKATRAPARKEKPA